MRDILEAVADGSLSPVEAEAELRGYVTSDAGRFDASRPSRRGIPEAILTDGKSTDQIVELAKSAMQSTERALVTRGSPSQLETVQQELSSSFSAINIRTLGTSLLAHGGAIEQPELDVTVGIVTAGTSDQEVADEAAIVCIDGGIAVERIDDVGVAALDRTLDQVERLRSLDVLIVAAGREGALPTVIAGLVSTPVIGVPVSTGYGHGGNGEAALLGMLQSCTVLSVVNIDAGFVAGAQARLIAQAIAASEHVE